jgi:hypothetical protein
MSDERDPGRKDDVVFVHSAAEAGEGYRVVRQREGAIEVGEIRPVQEGKPLQGELVRLSPRKEHGQLFDVEVLVSKEEALGAGGRDHAGPAQVATAAYRTNWEAIFGVAEEPEPQRDPGSLN